MEFLGPCLLQGKDSVERLDRVKVGKVFYLAKGDGTLQRGEEWANRGWRKGGSMLSFSLLFSGGFIWSPPSHPVIIAPPRNAPLFLPL